MSINRTVSPSRSTDTFYYHIKVTGLHSQNSYDLPINFKIFLYKGYQKIDTTRKTHTYQGNTCSFQDVLTFNMPLYNPTKRKVDFSLTLVEVAEEEIESTSCPILVGDMTEEFMKSGKNSFQNTGYFDNDDFSVDYVLYVDKNKANLLALVGSSQIRGTTPKPTRTPSKEVEPPVKSFTSVLTVETTEVAEEVVRKTPPPRVRESTEERVKIQRKNQSSESKSRSVKREEPVRRQDSEKKVVEPEQPKPRVVQKQPEPEPAAEPTVKVTKLASKPKQEQPPTITPQPRTTKPTEPLKSTKTPATESKDDQMPAIEIQKVKPIQEPKKKVTITPPPPPTKTQNLNPPKNQILASGAPHIVNSVYITKQQIEKKKDEEKKEEVPKPAEGANMKLIIAAIVIAVVILGLLFAGGSKKKPGKKPRK